MCVKFDVLHRAYPPQPEQSTGNAPTGPRSNKQNGDGMKIRTLLLGAAASLALGSAANATNINGYYVSLEGGAVWVQEADLTQFPGATPFTMETDTGWAVLATVGYALNNWRFELEGGYRENEISGFFFPSGGPAPCPACVDPDLVQVTFMANVLYDIALTERLSLSVGAGAGGDFAQFRLGPAFDDEDWAFAAQGIAGLNYAIGSKTDLFLTYRYLWVNETDFTSGFTTEAFDDFQKHTATIGLRYHFGAAAAEPSVAPPPPPPPPPAEPSTPREFIVFFGHNKSNLTSEALTVIKQAAAAAKEYGSATITVVGHADRSGSDKYNQKLSLRRAGTVKGALVTEGISDGAITVSARGESDPMVPTADGVREPQNRRVHISL